MSMQEALSKVNFYLTIFLSISIFSVYAGQSIEFIKTHYVIMVLTELVFVSISSIILYRLCEWCYKKKKPNMLFQILKKRHINKAKDRFNKLFEQEDDNELLKGYIDNAINDLKSNNNGSGHRALKQFLEWVNEENLIQLYAFNKLAESLKSISDEELINAIISVICVYNKKLNREIRG